ncbi:YqeG family HAD IIIA-type phosphatase [Mangrovibacillus cuniculi]|uniref:YqeG family HAD IIIA-type phosphatase n=1 Tax=Mangrovibacillus cuniculi TaxID=2593652 RepID=A0A7S8HHE2_9BACI|nr:YqeG family HAD IIIA-type phosphatase [Mangrovibacillus cuniculi]QPC48410.1 YqeG family HAD IIIA-type phosphatase [Mangrovibacillus cuniculi]
MIVQAAIIKEVSSVLKQFLPNEFVKSIFEITPESLKSKGKTAIITDLDNTLVEWDRPLATPMLIQWFEDMQRAGISITIVSNNAEKRVKDFSDPLGIPFIHQARKPLNISFRRAVKALDKPKEEIVMIGDQLMTDVLGGNRAGLYTILVVPVASTDGFVTKFNRRMERVILAQLRRKGHIQ